jgi:hypothetical protein
MLHNILNTMYIMKSAVLWIVTPCSLQRAKHFGAISVQNSTSLLPGSVGFLLDILLSPEEGSYMLLQNVKLFLNYMILQPWRQPVLWEPHIQHIINILLLCLAFSLSLKMELVFSSEMMINFYQTTWCWIPECSTFHSHLHHINVTP